jgi:transcriptional regulator with XRE-family HTH domain
MTRRRKAIGLSQEDLAVRVGVDVRTLRRWESGAGDPQPWHRPKLAAELDTTLDGLDELLFPTQSFTESEQYSAKPLMKTAITSAAHSPSAISHAQARTAWRGTRQLLNQHRGVLSAAALGLYSANPSIPRVLTRSDWLAPAPAPIERVRLSWLGRVPAPRITGSETASAALRPPLASGGRFNRYSQAIKDLERPSLFENRSSYRLVGLANDADGMVLEFGHTTYFDMLDTCEAVAHEFAAAWQDTGANPDWLASPAQTHLSLRNAIRDPFDLSARAVLPSIDTITLRRDSCGGASIFLHERNADSVAVAGSTVHVMPAGVFQPSSVSPWDHSADFDLWRKIMREYAEEFLGVPEADGSSGEPIDYARTEPYRSLERAREKQQLRVYFFGIVLDPLTLAAEIITAVVLDHQVFDTVFANMVQANSEGTVVAPGGNTPRAGIRFNQATVQGLLARPSLAPAAAACLELAWLHRHALLDW